jgi:Tfp pilus assembly protein PilE
MARPLDAVRFYLGRLGRVGAVGVLLIVASLAYDNAVVQPREAALGEQLLRNQQARRDAAAQRQRAAQTAGDATGQPALAPAAAAALRRLFDAAGRAGLELDRGEYRLTEIKDAHLRRYQLSLPVDGGYPEIRSFVAKALNADPALALTAIQLRRDRIESPDLEGLVNFTLYLELGA